MTKHYLTIKKVYSDAYLLSLVYSHLISLIVVDEWLDLVNLKIMISNIVAKSCSSSLELQHLMVRIFWLENKQI